MRKLQLAGAVALALGISLPAAAVDGGPFPLPASTGPLNADDPFLLSTGLTATLITDRDTLNAQGLPATFGNWDMSAFDASSQSIYVPAEVGSGAGVFRYDVHKGMFKVLIEGNASGIREADPAAFDAANDDFARLDPATATPFGSLLTGEETSGGRLFEIRNPKSNGKNIHVEFLAKVPSVAHEGLRFDSQGNLYFVDENNSGSVYKFVPQSHGNLKVGQSFVLVVDAFAGNAAENWNSATNSSQPRTGAAHWEPLTDEQGNALAGIADPFAFVTTTGGRNAADDINGAPYGRPEDITLTTLANGNEIVYFTATSENAVYGIELVGDTTANVGIFANRDTVDLATGNSVGSSLASPDNLETGADGTIYIIEDQNGGVNADIWKAVDANNDGVAESIGRWLSLGVVGAEPTGLEQDPNDPNRFILNIQHPASGNDALWEIRVR